MEYIFKYMETTSRFFPFFVDFVVCDEVEEVAILTWFWVERELVVR